MMAGYVGYSKSVNAIRAEREGKLPLSRATVAVAQRAGCTRKQARESLLAVGPCEWHHTSKEYNCTVYYAVDEACRLLELRAVASRLPTDWCEQIDAALTRGGEGTAAGRDARDAMCAQLAAAAGLSADDVCDAYYESEKI